MAHEIIKSVLLSFGLEIRVLQNKDLLIISPSECDFSRAYLTKQEIQQFIVYLNELQETMEE